MADETTTITETQQTETEPKPRGSLADLLRQNFEDLAPDDTPDAPEPVLEPDAPEPPAETPIEEVPAEPPAAVVTDVVEGELSEQQLFEQFESERTKVDTAVISKFQASYQDAVGRVERIESAYAALKAAAVEVTQVEDPVTGETKEVKKPRPFLPDELDARDRMTAAYNAAVQHRNSIVAAANQQLEQARVPLWCDLVQKHDKRFVPYAKQLSDLVSKNEHQRPNGDTLDKEDLLDLCAARWRRENPGKEPAAVVSANVIDAANAQRAAESAKKRGLGAISAGRGGASPVETAKLSDKKDHKKGAPAEVQEAMTELEIELASRRAAALRRRA
jgi:hypothetical protein